MGNKDNFLRYKFELNCGGGGGPKINKDTLPNYTYELNCGGGGGPLKRASSAILYEYENNSGGGGGPRPKAKVVDQVHYIVEHTVDQKMKNIHIDVSVKLQNYDSKTWRWTIGVPKDQIVALKCTDSDSGNQLNLNYVGDAIDVDLIFDKKIRDNFIISCDMKNEDFFDTFHMLGDRISFSYADSFWFNMTADLFMISFNFPPRIRIEDISPLPIDIETGNKLIWRRESWAQNRKFKLKMEGQFLP